MFLPSLFLIMEQILITIDNKVIENYKEYYFALYPRRKKSPINTPIPPSLNRYIGMKRMMQNSVKQQYKEFSMWLASYYKIANLDLLEAKIKYKFYFPDKRRRDIDNLVLTPKFFNDGFVESGVLRDDNGEILRIEFEKFSYDKFNPRVEITLIYKGKEDLCQDQLLER